MDPIILSQKTKKWIESMKFLKASRDELSVEEQTALEFLTEAWRTRSFDSELSREAKEMINLLHQSHKLHGNNRDIITQSKLLCDTATLMYTKDAATYNEVRNAIRQSLQDAKPKPTPKTNPIPKKDTTPRGDQTGIDPIILNQKAKKWVESLRYLMENFESLDDDEQKAVMFLSSTWKSKAFGAEVSRQASQMIAVLRGSHHLHGNNRKIIECNKEISNTADLLYTRDSKTFADLGNALKKALRDAAPIPEPDKAPDHFTVEEVSLGCDNDMGQSLVNPSVFYDNVTYIYPIIKYRAPNNQRSVSLQVKVIQPSGRMEGPSQSDSRYTFVEQVNLESSKGSIKLTGWGNARAAGYMLPGTWRVEVYVENKLVKTFTFSPKPKPLPKNPTIDITEIKFINTDVNGNLISNNLPLNTQYVSPVISYRRRENVGRIKLSYRIYNPDGNLSRVSGSTEPYTSTTYMIPDETGTTRLPGWGASSGNSYRPGRYKVEIIDGNWLIYTTYFNIPSSGSTPPPPIVTPQPKTTTTTTTTTSSSGSGSGDGMKWYTKLFWALVILGFIWWGYTCKHGSSDDQRLTVGKVEMYDGKGGHIGTLSGNTLVEVYEVKDGKAKIKNPDGGKAYVNAGDLMTEEESKSLDVIINDNELLQTDFGRKAIHDFITNDKNRAIFDNHDNWRVFNSDGVTKPMAVVSPDPVAPGVKEVLAFVVSSPERYQRGVYHLTDNGDVKRIMNQQINKGELISSLKYNSSSKIYDITYASDDKIVSPAGQFRPSDKYPLIVTDISLVPTDKNNKVTGQKITKKTDYISPKITYQANNKGTRYLKIKVYNPSGELVTIKGNPDNISYTSKMEIGKTNGTLVLDGLSLGSDHDWSSGYRFEVWDNNGMVASCKLKI